MILVYSHKITNRIKYSFKLIFTDVLESEVTFTDNKDEFEKSTFPKINYSHHKTETGIFFKPSSLLFETGIKEQEIDVFEHNQNKCFFRVSNESAMPFDAFAASFYLVTRYEEYLPQIRDQFDRFTAVESLAFQQKFLKKPLINIWANEIAAIVKAHYPQLVFPEKKFKYISTIDIDNAYAYKHKGLLRITAGMLKAIVKGNDFGKRVKVLLNLAHDPYDTFKEQFEIHQKYHIKPIYFFLLGDYGFNDKNISVKNRKFQSLIKSIADYYEVGIHPSYASNSDVVILTKEINRLKNIMHRDVTKSRQHFLKLTLPETYRNLIDNDITHDFTMGYSGQPGFRASICSPFYFYDLDTETATNLQIIPFAVMEATFKYYLKSSPEEANKEIHELLEAVKSVNGTFVSVWHNESLSDEGNWEGWKEVYLKLLGNASPNPSEGGS